MLHRTLVPEILKDTADGIHDLIAGVATNAKAAAGVKRKGDISQLGDAGDDEPELKNVMPPTARFIDELQFDDKLMATKKRKTVGRVLPLEELATKQQEDEPGKKRGRDEDQHSVSKEYYFKKKRVEVDAGGLELEAYCAAVCRFLAGSEYVTSVRGYYGNDGYVGLASRFMPDFKTNHADPLRAKDTVIQALNSSHYQCTIVGIVKEIYASLPARPSVLSGLKRQISFLFSHQEMDASFFAYILEKYLSNENKFTAEALVELSKHLAARLKYLSANARPEDSKIEMKYLQRLLVAVIPEYNILDADVRHSQVTIADFEAADRAVIEQNIDLDAVESLDMIGSHGAFRILASDLIKYRSIRGIATTLTARYLLKEADCHSSNMSKTGHAVDFGLTKYNLSYHLTNQHIAAELFKKPYNDTFKITERDVRCFPYLRDASPYYWPTKQTRTSKLLMKIVSDYLGRYQTAENNDAISKRIAELVDAGIDEVVKYQTRHAPFLTRIAGAAHAIIMHAQATALNLDAEEMLAAERRQQVYAFAGSMIQRYLDEHQDEISRLEDAIDKLEDKVIALRDRESSRFDEIDNQVYQDLFTHPVFIFHKFKTMLKYMLTDGAVYDGFAQLYIAADRKIILGELPHDERLIDLVTQDETARVAEAARVLTTMPEFKEFLLHDGELALDLIKRELTACRDKYNSRAESNPAAYAQMADGFKVGELDDRYREILQSCGIGMNLMQFGIM